MNKGVVLVLGTALISGISIFLNAFGVRGFDSSVFTFAKNFLVALFLISILLLTHQRKEIRSLNKTDWMSLVGIGLVGGSIPFLLFFRGLQLTSGSTGAFIHKTLFIWVALLAIFFLKERIHKAFIIGAALILGGNYFFLQPSFNLQPAYLLIGGATVFWAVENVWAKKLVEHLSGTTVAAGRMFFGSTFLLLFLVFTNKTPLITSMSLTQYAWILGTSILLLGYVLTYYNGIQYINISTAASILVLGSPITLILQTVFLTQTITFSQGIGMLFLGLGVATILVFTTTMRGVQFFVTRN